MKFGQYYTKEPFPYLVIIFPSAYPLRFRNDHKTIIKRLFRKKMKTFDNKIDQTEAQYNLNK